MEVRERLSVEERKKRICLVSKDLFLEKGFQNTTMTDVANRTGLSKGGLYHHYKNTEEILFDLMVMGVRYRDEETDRYIIEHRDLSIEDAIIEAFTLKMFEYNEYKSIYAMFLIETEKNRRLKSLYNDLIEGEKKKYIKFLKENHVEYLSCLADNEFMSFLNAMVVSTEILNLRDTFLKNKNFFKEIIRTYIKMYQGGCHGQGRN